MPGDRLAQEKTMQTPPPVRTAVTLPLDWFERASEMDCLVGIRARGDTPPPGLATIMVSEEEIQTGIKHALEEFTDPMDDLYPFADREQLYAASGQTLAALLRSVGTVTAPRTVPPPAAPTQTPVSVDASARGQHGMIAAADTIAAEITRRVAESDFYGPSAFAADPGETQAFLAAAAVDARGPAPGRVRVTVHGVSVLDSDPYGAFGCHGTESSAAWSDPAEDFVNEVELVLAPATSPSVLHSIYVASRKLGAEPDIGRDL